MDPASVGAVAPVAAVATDFAPTDAADLADATDLAAETTDAAETTEAESDATDAPEKEVTEAPPPEKPPGALTGALGLVRAIVMGLGPLDLWPMGSGFRGGLCMAGDIPRTPGAPEATGATGATGGPEGPGGTIPRAPGGTMPIRAELGLGCLKLGDEGMGREGDGGIFMDGGILSCVCIFGEDVWTCVC